MQKNVNRIDVKMFSDFFIILMTIISTIMKNNKDSKSNNSNNSHNDNNKSFSNDNSVRSYN